MTHGQPLHIAVGDDSVCCHVLMQAPRRATGRLGRFEVIEEEDDAELDEDEEEDGKKGKKKGKKGEKRVAGRGVGASEECRGGGSSGHRSPCTCSGKKGSRWARTARVC